MIKESSQQQIIATSSVTKQQPRSRMQLSSVSSCCCPSDQQSQQPQQKRLRMRTPPPLPTNMSRQEQQQQLHQASWRIHQGAMRSTLVFGLAATALLALSPLPVHGLTMMAPASCAAPLAAVVLSPASPIGGSASSTPQYHNERHVSSVTGTGTNYHPWSMVSGAGERGVGRSVGGRRVGEQRIAITSAATTSMFVPSNQRTKLPNLPTWFQQQSQLLFYTSSSPSKLWAPSTRGQGILGFQVDPAGGGDERRNPKQQQQLKQQLTPLQATTRSSSSSSSGNSVESPLLPAAAVPAAPWQHLGGDLSSSRRLSSSLKKKKKNEVEEEEEDGVTSWTSLSFWDAKQLPWVPNAHQIEQLTVVQLKQALLERGLPRTGNKVDLQRRFVSWTGKQQQEQQQGQGEWTSSGGLYRTYGVNGVRPSQRFASSSTSSGNMESTITTTREESGATEEYTSNNEDDIAWLEQGDFTNDRAGDDNDPKKRYRGRLEANSLAEWSRTVDLEPLLSRRKAIHEEKLQGKRVIPSQSNMNERFRRPFQSDQEASSSSVMSKEEYISVLKKVFDDSSSSRYSNYEVKQIYAAAKEADQMGDRDLSKRILNELKEATPHDMRIYRRLSRMEKEEGSIAEAKAILQEGLRLDPRNAFLWHGMGPLASSLEESKRYYRTAIECDPSLPMPYHALGTLEHSQGRIASAMQTLKQGLDYCPTNHRLHHALGDLYRDAKLLTMASKCYRKALHHGPPVSHGFAYNALAYVAYEDGNIDQSRFWLNKALQINDGRHANSWVALAQMEEAEGNIEAARQVCMTGISKYERGLLKRSSFGAASQKAPPPVTSIYDGNNDDDDNNNNNNGDVTTAASWSTSVTTTTATEVRNRLMTRVPVYRSGDRFFNVYRNWARLEERFGTSESVEEVYQRAFLAFPTQWKLTIDWAHYYRKLNLYERASELYTIACSQSLAAGGRGDADPYRFHAEYEILVRGNYLKARTILVQGALALSSSSSQTSDWNDPDTNDDNGTIPKGMAELYYVWSICEWHLDRLARSQSLLDRALQMTIPGEEGSSMRSLIYYAMAKLQQYQNEPILAQHYIGLCLSGSSSSSSMPNRSKVWELWAHVAQDMGNERLRIQCERLAEQARIQEEGDEPQKLLDLLSSSSSPVGAAAGATTTRGSGGGSSSSSFSQQHPHTTMQHLMRRDPWHYKIFGTSSAHNHNDRTKSFVHAIRLPLLSWEEEEEDL